MSTLKIIVGMLAPIDCAASMTPGSTSSKEDSIIRATYGAAAMTSGTIVAVEPYALPAIARVTGITRIIRIKNGMERKILTTASSRR